MARKHDQAARRFAKKWGGTYDPTCSPDVRGLTWRVEVKSRAAEVHEALRQLSGGTGAAYIMLPQSECGAAEKLLEGQKTGLVNYSCTVVKPSTRR